ncbi:MAG: hypothetical protein P2975_05865 [Gemmatimonadota bacterium]|jgi:hypothetical protein|nr:hypothetical protein [Gemmatimonadota bacterium]MDQ8152561.1 hypothetical protein [Gemmatimonadota bacterium]MDQ8175371.1 hypothetical protein [Gemmatimonadota bacterium]MDQ8178369.1 hypothetical protein [Gemmatimonadota bacterium]
MRRAFITGLLVLLVTACAAEPPGYEGPFKKQVRAAIPQLEEASGLRFLRLPELQTRSRDEVRSFLEQEFNAQLTPLELAGTQTAYRLLGLLPDTLELRAFLLDLLTEQVAGYYDPKTKVLYVVDDASTEMRDITITHELMHALQDQHTDLTQIETLTGDNDRMVAMQAVVEGQAVYEQLAVMTGGQDGEPQIPGGWGRVREMIREGQSSMPKFSSAPMLIQETLLFPYLSGAEFVRRVKRARPGIAPFSPFAASTEQILHPERFLDAVPDPPTRITLGAPRAGTLLHEDNLGEFETRLLLFAHLQDEAAAVRGAAGWDGDRYQVIETSAGSAFAWVTVWDSADEAAEFAGLLRRAIEARHGAGIAARRITIDTVTIGGRPVVRYEDAPGAIGTRDLIALDRVDLSTL